MKAAGASPATLIALATALAGLPALAQTQTSDRDLEVVRSHVEAGNYREALQRARDVLSTRNLSNDQRGELNKYAGLSCLNLGDQGCAEDHFYRLLQTNPDYVLDPFAVPPQTIRFFEDIKRKNVDALNLIRQRLALQEELARREASARDRQRVADEDQRRLMEQMARQVSVRTVEQRSFVVNFFPFGAGQFQQGRTGMGVVLASSEGALAATSIVAYLVLDSFIEQQTVTLDDRLGDRRVDVIRRGVPQERENDARTWRTVKYASAAAFYTVYAFGVVDALYHHEDEVVRATLLDAAGGTTSNTPRFRSGEVGAPPGLRASLRHQEQALVLRPFVLPLPGGVGAGMSMNF